MKSSRVEFIEWDIDNPAHKRRRRRQQRPQIEYLEPDEILEPEQASRIVVEHRHVVHHQRQRQHIPPWSIAILIIGMLCWLNPLGLVIALFMAGILLTAHPTVAIALGIFVALIAGIAIREHLARRPF